MARSGKTTPDRAPLRPREGLPRSPLFADVDEAAAGADEAAPTSNQSEWSVSELAGALKRTIEDRFGLVRVRGEISGFRGAHSSGHCYFTLKDERAALDAVVWRGSLARLKTPPQAGLEVIATGRLTTYPGASKYQLVIEQMEPAGVGALMALLEERRRRLAAEGLFETARKRPLPALPRVIGVVTSPTGAVIRDILHRLADRFPLRVLIWPVRVQGETSAAEVAAAIAGFNALDPGGPLPRPDLLIVARGGGSIEDLWGFNDEAVVRAAAGSAIPLISAVGHETDWTLIDHAADLRAPTPTAAAELAVPVRAELEARLATSRARLQSSLRRRLDGARGDLRGLARALGSPEALLAGPRQRLDNAGLRLAGTFRQRLSGALRRLERTGSRLSPALLGARTQGARLRLDALTQRAARALESRKARASERLADGVRTLRRAAVQAIRLRRAEATRLGARLRPDMLRRELTRSRPRLDGLERRLAGAGRARLTAARTALDGVARLLQGLSHQGVLERGFALLLDEEGQVLTHAAALPPGTPFRARLQDGEVEAVAGRGPRRPRGTARGTEPPPDQGRLL